MKEIDETFRSDVIPFEDVVWRDALCGRFSIHGLYAPLELGRYQRLPDALLNDERINAGARAKGYNTSGGRIRFATDSPYVAVAVDYPRVEASPHLSITGTSGVDLYEAPYGSADSRFRVCIFPGMSRKWGRPLPVNGMPTDFTSPLTVAGGYEFPDRKGELREITLYLPLYNGVSRILIGLAPNARILAPRAYTHATPVVVYGSSITQGACASRPGLSYMAILSRMLDFDFINLGFSGADLGEEPLAEYIATLPMSAFINEFAANSPSVEHLQSRHEPFYRTIRAGIGDVPAIIMSTPTNPYKTSIAPTAQGKRNIVRATVAAAVARGEYVDFLDGETVYGRDWDNATVDGTHPNDVGFMRLAERLAPMLDKAFSQMSEG